MLAPILLVIAGCGDKAEPVDSDPTTTDDCSATCDMDGDGYISDQLGGDDCDDTAANIHPGAAERCDTFDNDCDGLVDDADPDVLFLTWYPDGDADGFGDSGGSTIEQCDLLTGYSLEPGDCVDDDPAIHPDALEVCNGADDDCNGLTDDDDPDIDPATQTTFYTDADSDGYGDVYSPVVACDQPFDGVTDDTDCDDTDPAIGSPGDWVLDADQDGVGDGVFAGSVSCIPPSAYHIKDTGDIDCDDADPLRYPGAAEVCDDLIDQNCDGVDAPCRLSPDMDLLTSDARWEGNSNFDYVGSAAGFGDFNGDGLSDVALGIPGSDVVGISAGVAAVYFGNLSGLMREGDADISYQHDEVGAYMGWDLAGVGDLDGDGSDELLIGTCYGHCQGPADGRLFIASGGALGDVDLNTDARAILVGEPFAYRPGERVDAAGDLDGDGLSEMLVGAPTGDRVYLVNGTVTGTFDLSLSDGTFTAEAVGDRPGLDVAGGGDIDGDGVPDVMVGAVQNGALAEGAAYLFHGPVGGLLGLAMNDSKFTGELADDRAGDSLAVSMDLDGDGFDDVVIGAHHANTGFVDAGAIYVFYGPAPAGNTGLGTADAIIRGWQGDFFGGVLPVGDIDGDGNDDMMLQSMWGVVDSGSSTTRLRMFLGPVNGNLMYSDSDVSIEPAIGDILYGSWAGGVGDTDGDGYPDLLIGTPFDDVGGSQWGAAHLLLGGPVGP